MSQPYYGQSAPGQPGGQGPVPSWGPSGPPPRTNTMAVLAIVFAFVFPVLGIVFGAIARRQIPRTGEAGSTLASVGFVLGIVFTAISVLLGVAAVVFFAYVATKVGHSVSHLTPFPLPTSSSLFGSDRRT